MNFIICGAEVVVQLLNEKNKKKKWFALKFNVSVFLLALSLRSVFSIMMLTVLGECSDSF